MNERCGESWMPTCANMCHFVPTWANIAVCQLCRERQPLRNSHDGLNLTCLDQCHGVGSHGTSSSQGWRRKKCYKVYSLNMSLFFPQFEVFPPQRTSQFGVKMPSCITDLSRAARDQSKIWSMSLHRCFRRRWLLQVCLGKAFPQKHAFVDISVFLSLRKQRKIRPRPAQERLS